MKEYIDRDKLVKELECGIRAINYEDGYENYAHINDVDDCVDTVKYFYKENVVEKWKIYFMMMVIVTESLLDIMQTER